MSFVFKGATAKVTIELHCALLTKGGADYAVFQGAKSEFCGIAFKDRYLLNILG